MKILYILPFVPWPVRVRSYNLIPRLARKHEIHLLCVSSMKPNRDQKAYLESYCKQVVHVAHGRPQAVFQCLAALPTKTPLRMAYGKSDAARSMVGQLIEGVNPDVIYVERWRALQYLPEETSTPVLCDPTDSMTLYNRRLMRQGSWWERFIGWIEHRRFFDYEPMLARRADISVFCSSVDMECVKKRAAQARCELVPNGVDCEKFYFKRDGEEQANTLVFTGNLKYRPNWHALTFFLREIFPLIRAEMPETRFLVVGNGASQHVAASGGDEREGKVKAIDFVADLRPYIASAVVSVAPLTVGAGVSNKLLEGFATGTAVVATPLACSGLPAKSGEHLLIANNARQFAAQVIALLKDHKLRSRLALNARRLVEEKYDWEIVAAGMEQLLLEVAQRRLLAYDPVNSMV